MDVAKKDRRRNCAGAGGAGSNIRIGDVIEVTWDDVQMDDDVALSEVKPPFHFDPTTNIGRVVYCGRRLRRDWLIITSETPHDHSCPAAVTTAFPPGVLSTATVKVIRKARKGVGA